MFADNPEAREYWTNITHSEKNNIQILVTDNETGEIYAQTRHCQRATAYLEDSDKVAFIDYDKFRASVTDQQYSIISEYLLTEFKDKNRSCKLYYTEYYYQDGEVIPTKVQLFEEEYKNGEIVNKYPGKEFVLNSSYNESAVAGINKGDIGQLIETDFFFGKYKKADLLEEMKGKKPVYSRELDGPPMYYTAPFEMIVCETRDDIEIKTEDGVRKLTGVYAEKVNVLDECIGDIGIMCLFTITVFAVSGVIIGAIAWKRTKKQIKKETAIITE